MTHNRTLAGQHGPVQFSVELEQIRGRVLAMGHMVERQLVDSLRSFESRDDALAQDVVIGDDKVNAVEVNLDEECALILAKRQPAARDLRLVVCIIKTITDLERMGDEARKIAQMSRQLSESASASSEQYESIHYFGNEVVSMVRLTLNAFDRVDHVAALEIAKGDKKNDRQYRNILRALITYMMEDPRSITSTLNIIWVVRALERIGDHAKNICQYILYLVEGRDIRHIDLDDIVLDGVSPS